MKDAIKTLDVPNAQVLHGLVHHAILHSIPFGGHHNEENGWTFSIPANRYGEFLRLRETLRDL